IAEDLIELRSETPHFGAAAAQRCAAALAAAFQNAPGEEDMYALSLRLRQDLTESTRGAVGEGGTRADLLLRPALDRALDAFVELGSREAYARARIALERAGETADMLDALHQDPDGAPESVRRRSVAVGLVRQIDVVLLESGFLRNLLVLTRGPG